MAITDGSQQSAVDAGAHLVEKNDPGINHHGPSEFKELLLPPGKIAGHFICDLIEIKELDHFRGFPGDGLLFVADT